MPTSIPGAGRYRFVATRDESGSYAMVYAPVGRKFTVRMDKITGAKVKAWWFNPRDGKAHSHRRISTTRASASSLRPTTGEMLDWVLVLDDAREELSRAGNQELNGLRPRFDP